MKLMQLQRTMARAVMQPLTSSERMQRRAPDGGPMKRYASRFIKPNDRLTSFERLEIYNRQYWFRVLSALIEDFPGLRAVLGERRFDAMAKAYLIANPSRSFTLRNLGSRMESWLRKNPKWAGPNQALALDIARLEWADIEAFDGKAEAGVAPGRSFECGWRETEADAAAVREAAEFSLSRRRSSSRSAQKRRGHGFRQQYFFGAPETQARPRRREIEARANFPGGPSYRLLRLFPQARPGGIFHSHLRCSAAKLSALRLMRLFVKARLRPEQRPVQVQTWFQTWAALGWFCRPEKKRAAR